MDPRVPRRARAGADGLHDGVLGAAPRRATTCPVEIGLSPLQTDEGLLVSIAVRDVTEQRRIAAESQRLRDELIATVSHELRTPLTSIIGYASCSPTSTRARLGPEARQLLGVIERNATRELQLVDDLLTIAYLEDNRLRIQRAPIDLDAVAPARRRRLTACAPASAACGCGTSGRAAAAGARATSTGWCRWSRTSSPTRSSSPAPAAPSRSASRAARRRGVVEVRDTGVGVAPEEIGRLFERLYRGPRAIASQTQGAGLGLSIVQAIVEAHDGWVAVESEVGVGTTVRASRSRTPKARGRPDRRRRRAARWRRTRAGTSRSCPEPAPPPRRVRRAGRCRSRAAPAAR